MILARSNPSPCSAVISAQLAVVIVLHHSTIMPGRQVPVPAWMLAAVMGRWRISRTLLARINPRLVDPYRPFRLPSTARRLTLCCVSPNNCFFGPALFVVFQMVTVVKRKIGQSDSVGCDLLPRGRLLTGKAKDSSGLKKGVWNVPVEIGRGPAKNKNTNVVLPVSLSVAPWIAPGCEKDIYGFCCGRYLQIPSSI